MSPRKSKAEKDGSPSDARAARSGRIGDHLPRVGFGAASLGYLYTLVSDFDAYAVIEAMWAAGIRLYDTAALYGGGLSEDRVGKALSRHPRTKYILCTKVGRSRPIGQPRYPDGLGDVWDFSYDFALRSVAQSLERLQTDRLDVVHIHDPDNSLDEAMQGTYRALERLREEGVVGAIGVGSNSEVTLAALARRGEFQCFLLANRYTLLEQPALRELLPLCLEKGIAVIAGGVFNSGILATGPGQGATYQYQEAPPEIHARVRMLHEVCGKHGVSAKAAALQFPLGHPAVKTVLLGGKSIAHLEENIRLMGQPIPDALWIDLKAQGLIDQASPTPPAGRSHA
jgi:D-threo-aldose 1-dehydrogenase